MFQDFNDDENLLQDDLGGGNNLGGVSDEEDEEKDDSTDSDSDSDSENLDEDEDIIEDNMDDFEYGDE